MHDPLENHVVATIMGVLLHSAFTSAVLAIGANLTFRDIGRELRNPWLLVRTFLVACAAVPLINAKVVKTFCVCLFYRVLSFGK